ncbi:hypothetical protein FGO68_gene302 [Halteria grandinella]|uniref:Uncharacterized protein n=1 Tax=Halteria grandinella TaxID=5974 RepID=A0A8J8NUL4_HALGN|nr:hypothetical protein FGO68_gene302 [Halteria grandinella]
MRQDLFRVCLLLRLRRYQYYLEYPSLLASSKNFPNLSQDFLYALIFEPIDQISIITRRLIQRLLNFFKFILLANDWNFHFSSINRHMLQVEIQFSQCLSNFFLIQKLLMLQFVQYLFRFHICIIINYFHFHRS